MHITNCDSFNTLLCEMKANQYFFLDLNERLNDMVN